LCCFAPQLGQLPLTLDHIGSNDAETSRRILPLVLSNYIFPNGLEAIFRVSGQNVVCQVPEGAASKALVWPQMLAMHSIWDVVAHSHAWDMPEKPVPVWFG